MSSLKRNFPSFPALKKTGWLRFYYLDRLNSAVPAQDAWLDKVSQQETGLQLEGVARTNMVLSRFMRNLEGLNIFETIELISSRQKDYSGMKLYSFVLSCRIKKEGT